MDDKEYTLSLHDGARWITVGRLYMGEKPKLLLDTSRNYASFAKVVTDDKGDMRPDSKVYIHCFEKEN